MYKVKELIIVEGIYDKIKLSRFIDGMVFVTNGFRIIKNKEQMQTLHALARQSGAAILTDSDAAGFKIRNFLKQQLQDCDVKHAYIPDIKGKEKRKTQPGKEGLLGVEGISDDLLLKALRDAGCTIDGDSTARRPARAITKADFYADGLTGGPASAEKRRAVQQALGLPGKLSANMLLDVLNRLFDHEEYTEFLENLQNN